MATYPTDTHAGQGGRGGSRTVAGWHQSLPGRWVHHVLSALKGLPFLRRPEGRIFFIADLHFNHARIIHYCRRPYRSLAEMNRDLVRRWNSIVGPLDIVYCLGDFCMRGDPGHWIQSLAGRKVFIRGNHDSHLPGMRHHSVLSYRGRTFYLTHDPADVPGSWEGWVIHGHTHNNSMDIYPFINGGRRTINVSCECTGYAPVSLDFLLSLPLESVTRMETIASVPQKKISSPPARYF
ncbi:MAG: metallophosphoesterase [Methanolinea sp.]|nr:metallophosphoesterase [Methanolinea sp.]